MKLTLAILALGLAACVHPWGKQDPPKQPTATNYHYPEKTK